MEKFSSYYQNLDDNIKKYFKILYPYIPIELQEYIEIIIRLSGIDYFCGMKYASNHMYNFKYNISRLDHSISCALETLRFTDDFEMVLSALYHDCNTPIFSHVIDYLYKDYIKQEKSEENNDLFLLENVVLQKLLARDNYNIERIINPKQHPIIDNNRPKLCIDRLDGILLTSLAWTKTITLDDVEEIINNTSLLKNDDQELEIGFLTPLIAKKLVTMEDTINTYCKSNNDTFMMLLAADMIKYCINCSYIKESELYTLKESEFIEIIKENYDYDLQLALLYDAFTKMEKVTSVNIKNTKTRVIKPLYLNQDNKIIRMN